MRARIFTLKFEVLVGLAALSIAVVSPTGQAHQKKLPGVGVPFCDAETWLTPSPESTKLSPKAQKMKTLILRLAKILREIQGGETKYARWIHGFWNNNYRVYMELWGYTSDSKYRQMAIELHRLSSSPLFLEVRDGINDGFESLLQIQGGEINPDKAASDPIIGENRLAYQVLNLQGAIRRALRNDPEVRRLWQQRIKDRLNLPPDQRPIEAVDTLDLRAWVKVASRAFTSVDGAPNQVAASRGLSDHSFIHFANGLVGFEKPDLFSEFFVREKPNWVVRGHLDMKVVLGVFLKELSRENGRVRLVTQNSVKTSHSDQYRKFELVYQFPGYASPHKFQAVICWNPSGCSDRDGSKFLHGDIVTLYPRCGPDVYMAPSRDVFQSQLKSGMLDQGVNEKYIEYCK